jgi:hypothetical protein
LTRDPLIGPAEQRDPRTGGARGAAGNGDRLGGFERRRAAGAADR